MKTLEDLKAVGAFFSDKPVQKAIKFVLDGQEYDATIWVKRLSVGEQERLAMLSHSDDRKGSALLISEIVLLGDGAERISFEDAYRLSPSLAMAMMEAIEEVNGAKPKN